MPQSAESDLYPPIVQVEGVDCRIVRAPTQPSLPADVQTNLDHLLTIHRRLELLRKRLAETRLALGSSLIRWDNSAMTLLVVDILKADGLTMGPDHRALRVQSLVMRRRLGHVQFAVYVLLRQGRAIYVGRSERWRNRIKAHLKDKVFDAVDVYECAHYEHMCDLEAVLQQQHRPDMNIRIENRRTA